MTKMEMKKGDKLKFILYYPTKSTPDIFRCDFVTDYNFNMLLTGYMGMANKDMIFPEIAIVYCNHNLVALVTGNKDLKGAK